MSDEQIDQNIPMSEKDLLMTFPPHKQDKVKALKETRLGAILEENLQEIKESDRNSYLEIIKTFYNLASSDQIDEEELSSLVIDFNVVSIAGNAGYGGREHVADWLEGSISLGRKLFTKKDGEFIYDIPHTINHEISHSIIEIGMSKDVFPSEFLDLIDNLDPAFESKYINDCKGLNSNDELDDDVFRKEKLADLLSSFLVSSGDFEEFSISRLKFCDKKIETAEEMEQFAQLNKKLFDSIKSFWPEIREAIKDFDGSFSKEMEMDEVEFLEEKPLPTDNAQAPDSLPSSGSQQEKNPSSSKEFKEGSSIGQKSNSNDSIVNIFSDFIKSFSQEVPEVVKE